MMKLGQPGLRSRPISYRAFAALIGTLTLIGALSGASCPPSRTAYNSIDSVTTAVQAAIKIAAFESQTNPALAAKRPDIQAAYEKFQKAALLAADLSQQVQNKTGVLDILKQEGQQIIDLINSFLPDNKKIQGVVP